MSSPTSWVRTTRGGEHPVQPSRAGNVADAPEAIGREGPAQSETGPRPRRVHPAHPTRRPGPGSTAEAVTVSAVARPAPQRRGSWEGDTGQLLGKKSGVNDRRGEGLSHLEKRAPTEDWYGGLRPTFLSKKRVPSTTRTMRGAFWSKFWVNIRLKYTVIYSTCKDKLHAGT